MSYDVLALSSSAVVVASPVADLPQVRWLLIVLSSHFFLSVVAPTRPTTALSLHQTGPLLVYQIWTLYDNCCF